MRTPFVILCLAGISTALAAPKEAPAEEPKTASEILDENGIPSITGLRPANGRGLRKPNEVTVVLDPPSEQQTVVPPEEKPAEAAPAAAPPPPALIENLDAIPVPATKPEPEKAPPVAGSITRKQGVTVRVEKLQTNSGSIDPASVKLRAPFPAKPLSAIPAGWKLDSTGSAPPFTREVEISPGSKITLSIKPHVLIPDADGATTFPVTEPGYNTALGYQQNGTVGGILAASVHQLDEDTRRMGEAISRLQQLLVSLPKPAEEEAAPVATPVPNQKPGKRQ
jgi:hypothetical protein